MKKILSRLQVWAWPIPFVLLLVGVLLAVVLPAVDRSSGFSAPLIELLGSNGARMLLTAIAGAMLTAATTAFSITISVVATASSTYGPRLVGNFMSDRGNQTVLGMLTGTFLYSILVLAQIPGQPHQVPQLAVCAALVLAVADAGVIVYFISHITDSIQVARMASTARVDLKELVDRVYPADPGTKVRPTHRRRAKPVHKSHGENISSPLSAPDDAREAFAKQTGYLQTVDFAALANALAARKLTAWLDVKVGDYIREGDRIARVRATSADMTDEDLREFTAAFRAAASLGPSRVEIQDVRYATQLLIDMAIRALSPAMNDPFTAINAIDELSAGLSLATSRPAPERALVVEGHLALCVRPVPVGTLVDAVFDDIRMCCLGFPVVCIALATFGSRVATSAIDPELAERVNAHLAVLQESFEATHPILRDRTRVAQAIEQARAEISTRLNGD